MAHPFAAAGAELKALRNKLNYLTYQALFAKRLEERQLASTDAVAVHDRIEAVLTSAFNSAEQVTAFARSPQSYGRLFDTLTQFLELVEYVPAGAEPQQAQDLAGVPSPQAFRAQR